MNFVKLLETSLRIIKICFREQFCGKETLWNSSNTLWLFLRK